MTSTNGHRPPSFLDRQGLAELLGVSVSHVDDMRYDGTGPGYLMIGRAVRYPPRQVQEWIDANVKGKPVPPSANTAPSHTRGGAPRR